MAKPLDYMVFGNLSEPVRGWSPRGKPDNPALGLAFALRLFDPHLT